MESMDVPEKTQPEIVPKITPDVESKIRILCQANPEILFDIFVELTGNLVEKGILKEDDPSDIIIKGLRRWKRK